MQQGSIRVNRAEVIFKKLINPEVLYVSAIKSVVGLIFWVLTKKVLIYIHYKYVNTAREITLIWNKPDSERLKTFYCK